MNTLRIKLTIILLTIIMVIPTSYALLDCQGGGQAFFFPDFVERETISIPCTLTLSDKVDASCIAMILNNGELQSVTPVIEDVGLFGKTSYILINSSSNSTSFVVTYENKDLLHFEEFNWEIWCSDIYGGFHSSGGNITTEIPFIEPVITKTVQYTFRDSGQLVALFFVAIIVLILFGIIIKLVLNR